MAPEANGSRRGRLHLDNVLSSQPELGPAPPDGGYGWIVVGGVILLRVIIPSILLVSYGIFIMKANENNEPLQAMMTDGQQSWNGVDVWVPVLFSAVWSFTDPWSRTLAAIANIRVVATCGVLLTSLGLLATKFLSKLEDPASFYLSCLTSGMMAGIGASLATTPADHLLTCYFRLRLTLVQTIIRMGQAVGSCIMPFITCTLLIHYGYHNTLLIQSSILLQGLLGAAIFRKPVYAQPRQQGVEYATLQQNEDDSLPIRRRESHHEPQSTEDPNAIQPFYDSMSRPLFSDVELAASGQDAAFFIEDPADDDVVHYVYGDHLKRGVRYTEELKMFYQPPFYAALLLLTTTRLTNIAFWLLLPSLARSRISDLQMHQVAELMAAAGVVDVMVVSAGHWLQSLSTLVKKRITSSACFVAAGGLFALSYDEKLIWLICAAVVQRLGASILDVINKPMLKEEMGHIAFRHAHNLMDVFTGLLLLLTTLALGKDYGFTFWVLSWAQITAGTVWGLQPIIIIFHNKRLGH